MKIRPHTSSDYHAIAELRWHLKKDDVRGLNDRRKREYVDQYVRHLVETDQEGRTVHWLIEEDGAVVGVMTVRIVQKEPSPVRESRSWGLSMATVRTITSNTKTTNTQKLKRIQFIVTKCVDVLGPNQDTSLIASALDKL